MNPAPILGVGNGHRARLLTKAREPLLLYRADPSPNSERHGWYAWLHRPVPRVTLWHFRWVWYRIAASRTDLHGR